MQILKPSRVVFTNKTRIIKQLDKLKNINANNTRSSIPPPISDVITVKVADEQPINIPIENIYVKDNYNKLKHMEENIMAKGLDVGTAFLAVAEKGDNNELNIRSIRDAFIDLEQGDFVDSMLSQTGVNYIKRNETIYVVGDEAIELSSVFNKAARRPLAKGVINPKDKESLVIIKILLEKLIGSGSGNIYYSVPAKPVDADYDIVYHEGEFKKILGELGYNAEPINEGLAVIYSELEKENYTGIGISWGAGMTNVCFSYLAIPIFSFSISRSGDWIDNEVAQSTNVPISKVCLLKEQKLDLGSLTDDRVLTALQIVYENLITYVIKHIKRQFDNSPNLPSLIKPIPIVISGGTSMPKGFIEKFTAIWNKYEFPMEVSEIRQCKEPLYAVAKGALRVALAKESKVQS